MRVFRRFLLSLAAVLAAGACAESPLATAPPPAPAAELRVCADPDNWPLSHRNGRGLENRLAALLAEAAGMRLRTHWIPLQGRIVAGTLGAGVCDLLVGVPAGFPRTATSRPYLRSSFVWVQRAGAAPLQSPMDPGLQGLRIGVPRIRLDATATPPALALHDRGGVELVGYALEDGEMPRRLVEAVAQGEVDAAVLWGPQAGWFVRQRAGQLHMRTVAPAAAWAQLPMQVDLTLAVRPRERALLARLEAALQQRQPQLAALWEEFGVPVLPLP